MITSPKIATGSGVISQRVNLRKLSLLLGNNCLSLFLLSTLASDEFPKACRYKGKDGKTQEPQWRDSGSGAKYYPSYNVSPQSYT